MCIRDRSFNGIIGVQAVLGLGGGFDIPGNQLHAQSFRYSLGEHGFSGAGFSFNEQRPFQGGSYIDAVCQALIRYIGSCGLKAVLHRYEFLSSLLSGGRINGRNLYVKGEWQ